MKRHYPFNNFGSFHQRKIHVGSKELDLGIECEHRMSLVYDKTVSILMKNARNNWCDFIKKAHTDENRIVNQQTKQGSKQMIMDSYVNGRIIGKALPEARCVPLNIMPTSTSCLSCGSSSEVISQSCHFCEKLICSNCCRRCFRCCDIFCPLCSIKSYQEKEDTASCFSCS